MENLGLTLYVLLSTSLLAALVTFLCIQSLHPVAERFGLVDIPDQRKQHNGSIPLIGGISIFAGIAATGGMIEFQDFQLYMVCATVIVATGVIDDIRHLSAGIRLLIQSAVSLTIFYIGGYQLNYLGDLLGTGAITAGALAPLLTIVAIIGAINAFNMIDGIDGLAGTLAMNSFISLAIIFGLASDNSAAVVCLICAAVLIPYLLANLTVYPFKRKIFMGDAGSMLIGFTIVWFLITGTQSDEPAMRPVTVLWLIAIPLMDMAAIMIRRIKKGQSPLKPDRDHLHHIFMRAGFTPRQALVCIAVVSIALAGIGIGFEVSDTPEWIVLAVFMGLFFAYQYVIKHIWRAITLYHRFKANS